MPKKVSQKPLVKRAKKEVFYVGIKNAVEIRESILDSTREFVQVLKMYENYMRLKGEITHKVEKLQKEIKRIKNLNSRLKTMLPETSLRIAPVKKKKPVQQKENKKHTPNKTKPSSELDQLESELNMIESRLNKFQ